MRLNAFFIKILICIFPNLTVQKEEAAKIDGSGEKPTSDEAAITIQKGISDNENETETENE